MALQQMGTTAPLNGTAVYDTNPFDNSDVYTEKDEPIIYATAFAQVGNSTLTHTVSSGLSTVEDMASRGIGGIKFDWTSFPMIALKTDGAFEDTSGRSYGKSFKAKMIEAKFKFAHSFDGSKDPKNELFITMRSRIAKGSRDSLLSEFSHRLQT